jgi:hypothetical protein
MKIETEMCLFTTCLVAILTLLTMIGSFVPCSYGDERISWGTSLLSRLGNKDKPETSRTTLLPRVEFPLSKSWSLELEANLPHNVLFHERNVDLLGVNSHFLVRRILWGQGSWFILAGGDFGSTTTNRRLGQPMGSDFTRVLETGTGIEYVMGKTFRLRVEYRFGNISSSLRSVDGTNTHDLVVGITWP